MSVTLAVHIMMSCKLPIASPGYFCLGCFVIHWTIVLWVWNLADRIPSCNVSLCEKAGIKLCGHIIHSSLFQFGMLLYKAPDWSGSGESGRGWRDA